MNYPLHFLILGAITVLWLLGLLIEIHYLPIKGAPLPGSLGAMYGLSLVLAQNMTVPVIRKILLVVFGGLLSALVPYAGLFTGYFIGNVLGWEGEARYNDFYEYLVFGAGSTIGALTFALLTKVTILPRISFYLLPVAMVLCAISTWTTMTIIGEPSSNLSMLWLTFGWWAAFSVALFITDRIISDQQ